jgi:hypothetical protein
MTHARPWRILLNATLVFVSVGIAVAAGISGYGDHHHKNATSASSPPASSPSVSVSATPSASVSVVVEAPPSATSEPPARSGVPNTSAGVATAFVTAEQSLDWHWNNPMGFLPSIESILTAPYFKQLNTMAAAPSGQVWLDAKAGHVRWSITVTATYLVTAAPHGSTFEVRRVIYKQLDTGDKDHGRPGGVPLVGYLNVYTQKIGGRWFVSDSSTDGG